MSGEIEFSSFFYRYTFSELIFTHILYLKYSFVHWDSCASGYMLFSTVIREAVGTIEGFNKYILLEQNTYLYRSFVVYIILL